MHRYKSAALPLALVYATLCAWFASSLAGTPVITRVARRVHPLTPDMQAYTVRLTRAWALYFAAMAALSLLTFALLGLRAWAFFTLVLSPISLGVFVVGEHFLRYRWHPEFDRASLRRAIAYVGQDVYLFEGTIRDFVRWLGGRIGADERALAVAP